MNKKQQIENFFLGLLEGNGSIQVNHWKKRNLQYRIVIKLKDTPANYRMLVELRNELGFMNVHARNGCVLLVEDHQTKLRSIIKLIDKYGLFTLRKQEQYAIFRYCLLNRVKYSEYAKIKETGLPKTKNMFIWQPTIWTEDELLKNLFYPCWLTGFIEAEGCFCTRSNGTQSFNIGQKSDRIIIESIKKYFQLPNKIQLKKNDFYLIETSNRISLNNIIDLIKKYHLKGEKLESFKKFVLQFNRPIEKK